MARKMTTSASLDKLPSLEGMSKATQLVMGLGTIFGTIVIVAAGGGYAIHTVDAKLLALDARLTATVAGSAKELDAKVAGTAKELDAKVAGIKDSVSKEVAGVSDKAKAEALMVLKEYGVSKWPLFSRANMAIIQGSTVCSRYMFYITFFTIILIAGGGGRWFGKHWHNHDHYHSQGIE